MLSGAALALAALFVCCHGLGGSGDALTIALAVFPGEAEHYRAFVSDWERRKHVRVSIVAQDYADIFQALDAEARAGHGTLDLVELDLAMLGAAKDDVMALDRIVPPGARALFPEPAWQAGSAGGSIRFIPHRLMWQAMIYNRVRVTRPPATWDELKRFARNHPGKLALKAARYEGTICDLMPFVWSAGGSECAPAARGAVAALDFLSDIAPYLNPESAVFREMSVLEEQARGSVWIEFNWPFAMEYLRSKGLAPSVDASAPVPAGPDGRATALGGGYLGIPTSAPHPARAAAFIKYLLDAKTQQNLSRRLGWYGSVPPEPGSEQAALYSGYVAMRPFVRARPEVECYTTLSNGWQRATRSILFERQAPAQVMKNLAARLEQQHCRCEEVMR